MKGAPFETAFVRTLEHGACVGVVLPEPDEATDAAMLTAHAGAWLTDDERDFVCTIGPRRVASWVGGRVAMRRALRGVGHEHAGSILPNDRGAPTLPTGYVGSISHKETVAVALVAPARGFGIGVDVEHDVDKARVARFVLTERERGALSLDGRGVTLAFAIKEAIYKAVDPFVRRYVGFHEVELDVDATGAAVVTTALPFDLNVWWERRDGYVLATATARPQ